jgi:hypothetical protein
MLNLAANGRRLWDGLDLPGNVVASLVQGIAQNRPCFGSGCGGMCIQHDGLGRRLWKCGPDAKKNREHDPEQNASSHKRLPDNP